MRRAAVLALLLAIACSDGVDPLRMAAGDHPVTVLLREGRARVGVHHDETPHTCFAYVGTRQGGGHCMVAVGTPDRLGWVVEVAAADVGPWRVLMVAADPRVAEVRVPRADGGTFTVRPREVAGFDVRVAAVPVDGVPLRPDGNAVTAYDAAGRLLGRTHDCAGLGGPPDCGPWDGVLDARAKAAGRF